MATISELVVKISADTKALQTGIDQAGSKMDGMAGKTGTLMGKFEALKAPILVATGVIAGVGLAIDKAVKAFGEAESGLIRLTAAAQMKGMDKAVAAVSNLATQIQRTTGASGDLVVQLGAELIAQGKSQKQTEDLIKAAAELSAITGDDLSSSVKMLTNTYSGMAGAVGRQIPEIKNLTAEQLKNGAAVDIILAKYKGYTDQMSNTTEVIDKRFGEALGDLTEAIGGVFAPSVNEGKLAIAKFAESIVDSISGFNTWGDSVQETFDKWSIGLGYMDDALKSRITERTAEATRIAEGALRSYTEQLDNSTDAQLANQKAMLQTAVIQGQRAGEDVSQLKNYLQAATAEISARATEAKKKLDELAAARQTDINTFLANQGKLLASGIITEKQYLDNKIAFQKKLMSEIQSGDGALTAAQLAELKKRQGYIDTYNARLLELEKGVATQKVAVVRGAEKEAVATYVSTGEKVANVNAGVTKNTKEQTAAQVQAVKDGMASVQAYTEAAIKVAGALGKAFGVDVSKALSRVQSVATSAMKLMTNPADITAWADIAVTAIETVSDIFTQLRGDETEAQKKAREEREAERKDIEDKAEKRLATKTEALDLEMAAEIKAARMVGASTLEIEQYYAKAKVRARMEANEAIEKEQAKIDAQTAEISKANAKLASAEIEKRKAALQAYIRWADWRRDWIAEEEKKAEADISKISEFYAEKTVAEMEAFEQSMILFGDRATKATAGIGDALMAGLKGGKSRADFKTAIFDMLRDMAIEAAVMAAGIGEKFEEIGAYIATSLKDGFSTKELTDINAMVNSLYTQATAAITPLEAMFSQMKQPFIDSTSQKMANNTVIINSPIAVTPAVAASQMKTALQQMAFQGVI